MSESQKTVPSWKKYNKPWYQKLGLGIWGYIKNVALMLWSVIKAIPYKIRDLIFAIGRGFRNYGQRFVKGDWRTKISYLIMGFGNFSRGPKQFLNGFLYLLIEAIYVVFMVLIGIPNLAKLGTLGTVTGGLSTDKDGFPIMVDGDNSLKILIFSVFALLMTITFLVLYVKNTQSAYANQKAVENGQELPGAKQQIQVALNDKYHITVLTLPVMGVLLISVIPLICNILIAFTNYNYMHDPASGSLFTWVGLDSFTKTFTQSYGTILWRTLGWTLVWAIFATFTNFFFGMFLAMMINKKSIKLKVFWRTCFVIVIAVPDFVSLMLISQFFSYNNSNVYTGAFNQILMQWFKLDLPVGGINWFGGEVSVARVMVIVVNLWRGMPFTMLATMGILMNIPAELYESSRIDGAGPVRQFVSITFPYIMFVMGPQLITTFTGNINNFNVIFFLTGGGPYTNIGGVRYGATNLFVTWLYDITMNDRRTSLYNIGSVIGIFTFVVTAFFALIVFNSSKSNKEEGTFQ